MKKLFLFIMVHCCTLSIFSSQPGRKTAAIEVKSFLEEVASLRSLAQEKQNQQAALRKKKEQEQLEKLTAEESIKATMRELTQEGIELARLLEFAGFSQEQALAEVHKSSCHKKLMAICARYDRSEEVLLELYQERFSK